jgi:hypothetical protein
MRLKMFPLLRVLALVAFMQLGCGKRELPAGSAKRPFSSAEWKTAHSSDWREGGVSVREEMLHDLMTRILPGKTRAEIEDLLGSSLVTPYFRSINKDLIYYLGPERGSAANIDSEWLLIWLDSAGRYHHYRIVND